MQMGPNREEAQDNIALTKTPMIGHPAWGIRFGVNPGQADFCTQSGKCMR
jgi:hypothetical protein